MPTDPQDQVSFRLASLERRVTRLEDYEPAAIQVELGHLREDVTELRETMHGGLSEVRQQVTDGNKNSSNEVNALKRVLIGFALTFSFFGITLSVTFITQVLGAG